jgi:hypothetical protein
MIEPTRGRVWRESELILDDAEVWIISEKSPGADPHWRGWLTAAMGSPFQSGQIYRLELSDGRNGQFVVTAIKTQTASESRVDFDGFGPLNRPTSEGKRPPS